MKHAVIWIDQKEARIFEVDADKVERSIVDSPGPHIHRHANEVDLRVRNHPDDEHRYFRDVARTLRATVRFCLSVPPRPSSISSDTCIEHDRPLEAKIVGIESADHPTDAQLVAHLRSYFHEPSPRRGP